MVTNMKIKKGDVILAIILIVIGIISLIYINNYKVENGQGQVVVTNNGKLYGTYSLNENKEFEVKSGSHINRFKIENGKVKMVWANCSNQDCIRQGIIKDGSKAIICLPNKVVIEIKSKKKEFDTISQ